MPIHCRNAYNPHKIRLFRHVRLSKNCWFFLKKNEKIIYAQSIRYFHNRKSPKLCKWKAFPFGLYAVKPLFIAKD